MNSKITPEHLRRAAVVYVRQSTPMQVSDHLESQRRQYALAETAHEIGFARVETIDEDLGRSGSGVVERPGFQRLVAGVCAGTIGAVFCLEASRLARNGRDWHHLIDLCALVGTLLIDHDGTYDPRLVNDRLVLGLKGTMSEYELSLLRQRSLAARDAKARRGELRVGLPPGYTWDESGHVELDSDEQVVTIMQSLFRKFAELGRARQVLLWLQDAGLRVPVVRSGIRGARIVWQAPAYHNVLLPLRNPTYAGAYVFGRTEYRTRIAEGRARKTSGHRKPRERWSVLIPDHHPGYITWAEFERNQRLLGENAHMQKRAARKAGRGGRALLTGLLRCGRCGRMLPVFYGMGTQRAHRYLCRREVPLDGHDPRCVGIGGVRVDRAVSGEMLAALAPHAVEAALLAAERATQAGDEVRRAVAQELEAAGYDARLAARRYEAVDPDKRLVARTLEARWEAALEYERTVQERLNALEAEAATRPPVDRARLLALAEDLTAVWNAASTDMRHKQRLTRVMIQEIIADVDAARHEVVLVIHWVGGRHTEIRVARVRGGRYPEARRPTAVEALRQLGGRWPDRELAVTLNRMRCRSEHGGPWTTVRVRELRERLGIPMFTPDARRPRTISAAAAAERLSISVASVRRLIGMGALPAIQVMPSAPWEIPFDALDTEAVRIGVRAIVARRPGNFRQLQDAKTLRLPGV
jgi:DNA invertase Pin-like site-specific DNA recombinase